MKKKRKFFLTFLKVMGLVVIVSTSIGIIIREL